MFITNPVWKNIGMAKNHFDRLLDVLEEGTVPCELAILGIYSFVVSTMRQNELDFPFKAIVSNAPTLSRCPA